MWSQKWIFCLFLFGSLWARLKHLVVNCFMLLIYRADKVNARMLSRHLQLAPFCCMSLLRADKVTPDCYGNLPVAAQNVPSLKHHAGKTVDSQIPFCVFAASFNTLLPVRWAVSVFAVSRISRFRCRNSIFIIGFCLCSVTSSGHLDNGSNVLSRNVRRFLSDWMASCPRIPQFSLSPLWEPDVTLLTYWWETCSSWYILCLKNFHCLHANQHGAERAPVWIILNPEKVFKHTFIVLITRNC
jgi:hypothetical protein